MSYILDALKKSEQERGHGRIPDVQTVHSSSLNYRSEKTSYWPYILVAAVTLNLLAIIYFNYDKSSGETITETSLPATDSMAANKPSAPINTSPEVTSPAIKQPPVMKQRVMSNPVLINKIAAENLDKTSIDTATPASKTIVTTGPDSNKASNKANNDVSSEASNKTSPQAINDMSTSGMAVSGTSASSNKEIKAEQKSALSESDPPIEETTDESDVIEYYDLPVSISSQLPAIIISAHIYSTNPEQRSIVINNKFLEEGDYVIDNLILYEITNDGAIFLYDGILFHNGVVGGWQ